MNLHRFLQLAIRPRAGRIAFLALLILAASVFAKAQQGYTGLSFDFMDPMTSSQYGLNMGAVVVVDVVPGSPGEQSGLRLGDIITSVDGIPMRSADQVTNAFRAHKPGDKVRAGIIHPMGNNRNMSLEIMVSIGRAPANAHHNGQQYGPQSGQQYGPPQGGNNSGYYPGNAPSSGNGGQWNPAPQGGGGQQPRGNHVVRGVGGGQPRPVQVQMVQQGPCRAAVFQGWQLVPGPNGQSADINGPNGAHVGWGITNINPAMRQYYGDMHGPPEVHIAAMISYMLQAPAQFTSTENVGNYFTAHQFRAGNNVGVVLYHVYPAPMMGQYIISEYSSWAPQGDEELLAQAEAIMTTLQCTASIRPPQPTNNEPPRGTSGRRRSTGSAEGDSLKDYNSILGTQYAHDPGTGTVYHLSRDQMTNGPEGEGYYVGTGVNRHMLTPGLD